MTMQQLFRSLLFIVVPLLPTLSPTRASALKPPVKRAEQRTPSFAKNLLKVKSKATRARRPNTLKENFDAAIRFDQTAYSLVRKGDTLTYRDPYRTHRLVRRACNHEVFDSVAMTLSRIHTLSEKQKRKRTPYDVELRSSGRTLRHLARGDAFGTWLREFPSQIMYLETEAELQCLKN